MTDPSIASRAGRRRVARHILRPLLLVVATLACAGLPCQSSQDAPAAPTRVTVDSATACNGADALCDRRYDQVAYATTHNAMSSQDAGFWAANQGRGIRRQLADGVRALMLDTHYFTFKPGDRRPYLCHKVCLFGATLLEDGLRDVRRFLDSHPREVVTLLLESHVSAEDTRAAFARSGLLRHAHVQDPAAPWPTLGQMIAAGKRLVVLTERGGGRFGWYHDAWRFAWETPYAAWTAAELSCGRNRGRAGNGLFIFNHFLSNPLPDRLAAAVVNQPRTLLARARRCQRANGDQLPNFVTVDHYDVGDVVGVVRQLNGLDQPQVAAQGETDEVAGQAEAGHRVAEQTSAAP